MTVNLYGFKNRTRHDLDWHDNALCKTAAWRHVNFFPPEQNRGPGGGTRGPTPLERAAIAVCCRCPVRQDCLEYALDAREQHGIWGSWTEAQRRSYWKAGRMRQQRARETA